ncbi:conjugal transfer protein TraI [Chitinophaga lutea]|uniref:Conjugal transfer protein TraI n=1 Tax=Chitinophaga lutea TaxID=2488634 RepID=A0A3N4Q1U5_9BACT|nr:conjugal transfer protein TraI [Chitinophaga lutea]RPE13179.1 conjugal transfer protein TraI [Chitinophaga lutea]
MLSKTFFLALMILLLAGVTAPPPARAQVFVLDLLKTAAKKVIRAIDLQVQRIQNRTIVLQNIQKELENVFSKLRLDEISDWSERQKQQYSHYFEELWRVKAVIAYYQKILRAIDRQKDMVEEYKRAFSLLRQDKHFSAAEIRYMYEVYTAIIGRSLQSAEQIVQLVTSFSLQMTDAQRLQLLETYQSEIDQYYVDMRRFTDRNIAVSISRAKTDEQASRLRQLYQQSPHPLP